jgi:hypothetical protein
MQPPPIKLQYLPVPRTPRTERMPLWLEVVQVALMLAAVAALAVYIVRQGF